MVLPPLLSLSLFLRACVASRSYIDAGQNANTPSDPTDSQGATDLNGQLFLGTKYMKQMTIGKEFSSLLIRTDTTELQGHFSMPSDHFFDTTGGNTLQFQSDGVQPFTIRR